VNLTDTRVLVTGGAGFIGTALAKRYADRVGAWVAYDNLLPQVHGERPDLELPESVRLVAGDVRDAEALTAVVADLRPDLVIHLAAETGTGQSLDLPSRHTDVNVTGTAVLLQSLDVVDTPPRRVVLTSSRAVYGEGGWVDATGTVHHPRGRTQQMLQAGQWDFPGLASLPSSFAGTAPAPCNVYGATKLAQEHLLTAWATARGVSTGIVRLQNVYGPGQSPINPYTGITTLFFRIAGRGEAIPVYEDGEIGRDLVFIDDVARAVWTMGRADHDALADVGSGTRTTIGQIAEIIAKFAGAPTPTVTGQYRLGDVRSAYCTMAGSDWVFDGIPPVGADEGLSRLGERMAGRGLDV
jgi:dTDP-L-rhamnose 4-epimerase